MPWRVKTMPLGTKMDAEYAITNQQLTSTPVHVALTTSADESTELAVGRHRITCTEDCYVLQGATGVDTTLAAVANGHFLAAGVIDYIYVTAATDAFLAGIVASGTATLCISQQ